MKLEFLASGSDDCPLVRLYGFDHAEVAHLHAGLSSLASGEGDHIVVHALHGVESISDCRLVFHAGTRDTGMVRHPGSASLECILTPESWDNVAGLIEPFLTETTGYQWLVTQGDARLVLSKDGKW